MLKEGSYVWYGAAVDERGTEKTSGKLGKYMVKHALARGYEVVAVCREKSVEKLEAFKGRITIVPGATNDRAVFQRAVAGCDGVLEP